MTQDELAKLTNEQRANLGQGYSNIPGQFNTATGQAIDPSKLKPNTPPVLKPTEPTTTTPITISDIPTMSQNATNAQDTAITDYLKSLTDQGNIQAKEAGYVTEEGGDTALKAYKQYKSDLEAEQKALRDQKENVRKSFQGTTAGLQSELGRIERESLNKQADLAILANASQGQYESALDIAKRKVDSELAPIKAQLEAKKFYIEQKSGLWNAQQMAEANRVIKAEERAYDEEKARKDKGNEMIINALSQGASPSATSKAKDILANGGSIMEVASVLGKYAGDYLGNQIKIASLAKTNAEIKKLEADIKASEPIDTSTLPNTTAGFATKLLASAKSDKQLDATERQQMTKMSSVIGQIDSLQSNLSKNNMTGIIKGRVNKLLGDLNLNKDITTINAQIQALIPNVARGVYGEVGVLTDADIENYKKTVASLKYTQDQNDAILALTLKNALRTYEGTLNTAVNSGINVSGWTQDYVKIQNKINEIEDRIGVSKEAVNSLVSKDPNLLPAIKEMYNQGFTDGEILEALKAR